MRSRNDADRLSAFADARDAASSLSTSTPAVPPTNSRGGTLVLRTGRQDLGKGDLLDIGYVGYLPGTRASFDSLRTRFEVGAGNVIQVGSSWYLA